MAEVITDERMRTFVHSSVSTPFELTIETIAERCKTYGRFSAWLNEDVASIINILTIVQDHGVSPAFFAAYEVTEGYNSQWGWLNHTSPNGDPANDAGSVSDWIVTQSNNTTDTPAWIDYANYNDFVPEDVKAAGNADFANMTPGSIGKVVIAGTAAATWEVYYPNGLKAEYNGVQDYGAPITGMMDVIEDWGGRITGSNPDPEPEPNPDVQQVIDEVIAIVEQGQAELEQGFSLNTDQLAEQIMTGLQEIYNPQLYLQSQDFYSNLYFNVKKTFDNLLKLNPSAGLDELIQTIIEEAVSTITVTLPIEEVFSDMINQINQIQLPDGGNPDPEPDDETPILPMAIENLYVTSEYGERNGRLHDGIDFGVGGNPTGQAVYAVMSGEVMAVHNACDSFDSWGCGGEIGNHITIKHTNDSRVTRYIHLGQNSVPFEVGDSVKQGDQVGVMANSGSSQGIHLHFTVATSFPIDRGSSSDGSDGNTIDPRSYINKISDVPSV